MEIEPLFPAAASVRYVRHWLVPNYVSAASMLRFMSLRPSLIGRTNLPLERDGAVEALLMHDNQVQILIIVMPNFNIAATTGFVDPFRAANYVAGKKCFHWEIASLADETTSASNGMIVQTRPLDEVLTQPQDVVVVSASWTPETHNSARLRTALQRWARNGVLMGGIDTGAFTLAQAGLLRDHRATVHYEHIDAFRELHGDIEISEDLFVFDRKRFTCCGGIASSDTALHIIRQTHGDALANDAARYVFHPGLRPHKSPQSHNPVEPLGSTVPQVIKNAVRLMEDNLEEALSVPDIAERIGISQRQLDRLFRRYVRKSPSLYYRDIRLDRARGLVTQTSLPLSEVAVATGFAGQVHFSRAYRQRFGLPPRDDRIQGRIPFEYRAWPMHKATT